MALSAIHIRASPPPESHIRTRGLGSSSTFSDSHSHSQRYSTGYYSGASVGYNSYDTDDVPRESWAGLGTGSSSRRRIRPIRFVRATAATKQAEQLDLGTPLFAGVEGGEVTDVVDGGMVDGAGLERPREQGNGGSPAQQGMSAYYAELARQMSSQGEGERNQHATSSKVTLSRHAGPSVPPAARAMAAVSRSAHSRLDNKRPTGGGASSSDWFIGRAVRAFDTATAAALQAEREAEEAAQTASLARVDSDSERCRVCGSVLPFPRSAGAMAQHNLSMAHRLAVDPPYLASTTASNAHRPDANGSSSSQSGTPFGASEQDNARGALPVPKERFEPPPAMFLKRTNRGYGLLERMGWEEGMGLGRDEWEWEEARRKRRWALWRVDRDVARTASGEEKKEKGKGKGKAAEGRVGGSGTCEDAFDLTLEDEDELDIGEGVPPIRSGTRSKETGATANEAISISDSDSDGEDESQLGTREEGTEDWNDLMRADSFEIGGDGAGEDVNAEEEEADGSPSLFAFDAHAQGDMDFSSPPPIARERPRLVPISVSLKNDKRGLGLARAGSPTSGGDSSLKSKSKAQKRNAPNYTPLRREELARQQKDTKRRQRFGRGARGREAEARAARDSWIALRQSLG